MTKIKNTDHFIPQATIDHLTNAHRAAKAAADDLRDQYREVRKLSGELTGDEFRVREYPGRYQRGVFRGSQRLIYGAQTLDIVMANITAILKGQMPGDRAVNTDYREINSDVREYAKGNIKADPAIVRGALGKFGGHIARADATREGLRTVKRELNLASGEPGVSTALDNARVASEYLANFSQYLGELGSHATKVVDAFDAWDKDGKVVPGLPPVKIRPASKTRDSKPNGTSGKPDRPKNRANTPKPNAPDGSKPNRNVDKTKTKQKSKSNGTGDSKSDGRGLDRPKPNAKPKWTSAKTPAQRGLDYALGQLKKGVREVGSSNTGTDVNKYLSSTGLGGGYPWCAAFVRWCMEKGGFKFPKGTSWAACEQFQAEARRPGGSMFVVGHGDARPGDLIVWGGRHIGIVESRNGGTIHYVAGNEGDAVRRGTSPTSDGSYTIIRHRAQG